MQKGTPAPSGETAGGADRETQAQLARSRRMRAAKLLAALAILILLIVFIIQNSEPVTIDWVFFQRESRVIWVMVTSAVLGGVVGYLIARPGRGEPRKRKAK
ncbi:MAG: LapA family protein [Actinomycetota bacterium]